MSEMSHIHQAFRAVEPHPLALYHLFGAKYLAAEMLRPPSRANTLAVERAPLAVVVVATAAPVAAVVYVFAGAVALALAVAADVVVGSDAPAAARLAFDLFLDRAGRRELPLEHFEHVARYRY